MASSKRTVPLALPHVKTGRLRVLGVTTLKRSPVVPDIPPIAESGGPGYEVVQWYAMFVRSSTPREIVNRVNAEVKQILGTSDLREKLASQGANPATSTPEDLAAHETEIVKWAKIVKQSGAKVD